MHKSLLEILEAEKKIVNDVNFFKDSCNNFSQELGIAENNRIMIQYKESLKNAEEELVKVRKELKKYICFLMEQ